MREGAEFFTEPAGAGQRRYEALRAYFLEDRSAAEVADRFGYSTASVHQMATLLRKGRARPPEHCGCGCWNGAPTGAASPRSPPR